MTPGLVNGVVLPVRGFSTAFARLAPVLRPQQRHALARALADRAARAVMDQPTVVVSSDAEVRDWAAAHDLALIADPGSLNDAAAAGHEYWAERGADRVTVVHLDLPLLDTLRPVTDAAAPGIVVLVPCHRDDGTPVLNVPAGVQFPFAYGPGSFAAHTRVAHALGLHVVAIHEPALRFDVDLPEDLAMLPDAFTALLADAPD